MTTFKAIFDLTYNPPVRGLHSKKKRQRRKARKKYALTLRGMVDNWAMDLTLFGTARARVETSRGEAWPTFHYIDPFSDQTAE